MKNCAFQYATSKKVIEDTSLITFDEAKNLFKKHELDFIERLKNDEKPEMAIWVNMNSSGDYNETFVHWHYSEFFVKGGCLHNRVSVDV